MATFTEIATSALVNLLTTFLFLLAFSVLRLQPQNARVYYPKWYIKGVRKSSGQTGGNKRLSLSHYVNLDYKAYLKLLTWMWDAILMPEEELIEHAGLDSAVFLRIFLLGLKIFSPMAGIGFLILLPVNATDNNLSEKLRRKSNDLSFSDIDKLSISNVADKSPRLWAHLIMAYIFTIWTCKMVYQEYKVIADMRLEFLAKKKRSPDQFTVKSGRLIRISGMNKTDIPAKTRKTPQAWKFNTIYPLGGSNEEDTGFIGTLPILAKSKGLLGMLFRSLILVRQVPPDPKMSVNTSVDHFFETNTPDYLFAQIACTEVVYDANGLGKTLDKIAHIENWLSYYQNKYDRRPYKRPLKKNGFLGLWGEEVDAINYYKAELEKMRIEARKEQDQVLSDPKSVLPAAFVSFKSRWAAAVCAQTHQTRNPNKWITEWAPEVRDVYWPSLSIPYLSLPMRHVAVAVALFLLMFFYMIPVLAVQSLANLDGLVNKVTFIRPLVEEMPVIKSFLQGFMAGLALRIFLALLPMILMFMSKLEGHLSRSALDRKAATKLYYFMVVNVFFGSVITGSLIDQLWAIINSVSITDVLKNFGYLIPMKATFFITFIMVDGWAGVSWEIVRPYALGLYHLKNMFLVKTEKDRDEAMAPGNLLLNENIPRLELYFLLGIVYAVTTPIILPFIMVFFGFGYLAYRNQVINVYDPDYDSGAAFWPSVQSRIITAMIIGQLTLFGLFTIKGPVGFEGNSRAPLTAGTFIREMLSSTPFLAMLPIGTLIFHSYCKRRFRAAFEFYPMAEANEKDRSEEKDEPELDLQKYLDKSYLHPVLKEEQDIQGKFRTVKTLRRPHKDADDEDDEDSDSDDDGPAAAHQLAGDSSDLRLEVMDPVPYTTKSEIHKSSELLLDSTYRHQKSDGGGGPPSRPPPQKSDGGPFKHQKERSDGSSSRHHREKSNGSPPRHQRDKSGGSPSRHYRDGSSSSSSLRYPHQNSDGVQPKLRYDHLATSPSVAPPPTSARHHHQLFGL